MATKISEYSATPASNTDLDGINLSEDVMVPSDVNDALRMIMAHLKDMDAGTESLTSLSVTGTVTANAFSGDGSSLTGIATDLVDDSTPQLGGTLDANGNTIDMGTNTITDTKVGQWDTAYGWGDHSTQNYAVTTGDTFTGDLNFGDNVKAQFGAGNDLQIYHDSATGDSNIDEIGTGNLVMNVNGFVVEKYGAANEKMLEGIADGAVNLYHNGLTKLATKSDGVDITGELQADSLDIDGSGDITGNLTLGGNLDMSDNDKILVGTSDDLEIYHDGSHSYIKESGTGNLKLLGTGLKLGSTTDEFYLFANQDAEVTLYYNNVAKLETTSYGIHVDGTGAAAVPSGTTAQRPTGVQGQIRYNTTDGSFEGYDGSAWGELGGGGGGLFKGENGEVGSSAGDIFRVHEQTLNTNVTIDSDENGLCAGPLTIASGVTLTVNGNLSIV